MSERQLDSSRTGKGTHEVCALHCSQCFFSWEWRHADNAGGSSRTEYSAVVRRPVFKKASQRHFGKSLGSSTAITTCSCKMLRLHHGHWSSEHVSWGGRLLDGDQGLITGLWLSTGLWL